MPQVPPPEPVRVIEEPMHTVDDPDMVDAGYTFTVIVAWQPLEALVNVTTSVPPFTKLTIAVVPDGSGDGSVA